MSFTDETIQKVWEKGETTSNNDANVWRKDACMAWIKRSDYGNRKSMYGWEIDHINPNGGDAISNLRPLQWENNVAKSDGKTKCVVISDGINNVNK